MGCGMRQEILHSYASFCIAPTSGRAPVHLPKTSACDAEKSGKPARVTQARVPRDCARGAAKRAVLKHCRSHQKAARRS
jgi:hypothetical protein